MSRTLSLLRSQPQRLLLLAALAALLAGFALATQNASAQTTGPQVHWVRVDCDTPATIMQPNAAGKYAYDSGDDLCAQLWVVNAAQTAGAAPAAGSFPNYDDFEWLILGLRSDDPSAGGAGSISNRNGNFQIGVGPTSGAHSYGFQREVSGTYTDFHCPARWGSGNGFGLPCGTGGGEGTIGKAHLLNHPGLVYDSASPSSSTGAPADGDMVNAAGSVFKLVVPQATLNGERFFLSARIKTMGLTPDVERENAIEFVNTDYREVSVYRIKDGTDGFAPCADGDTDAGCTSDPSRGYAILMGSTLTKGDDAMGDPIPAQYSDFDKVEVQIKSSDGTNNAGIVFHPQLCPVSVPSGVSSPFASGTSRSGNDQLGVCTYNQSSFSDASGDYDGTVGPFIAYTSPNKTAPPSSNWRTDGIVYVSYSKNGVEVASGQYEFTGNFGGRPMDDSATADVQENYPQGRIGTFGSNGDLALRIGYIWDSSSPEGAITGDYITTDLLPDYEGPDDLISLTVKGKGTVRLLNTDWSCSDDGTNPAGTTCNLTDPDGADNDARVATLMTAMLNGRTQPAGYGRTLMHFSPLALRVEHDVDDPQDIKISGRLKNDGAWDQPIPEYVAAVGSAAGSARVIAWLPDDADGRLAPSQEAQVAVGYEPADATTRRFHGDPAAFWYATAYEGVSPSFAPASTASYNAGEVNGYLVLNGPAVWDDNGGKRLRLNAESGFTYVTCATRRVGDNNPISCRVSDSAGAAPKIRVDADAGDADITVTGNIPVWSMAAADGTTFAERADTVTPFYALPTNSISYQRALAFGTATLRVGAVEQIASVSLTRRAVDGITPSGTIPVGQTKAEDLVLSIRNADNAPTQETALSAITLSVIGSGRISSDYCPDGELTTCTVNLATSAGNTAENSLRLAALATPSVLAGIPIEFHAPDKPGTSRIVATVIGGNGQTYSADPLELVVSGTASRVAVTGDMPRLLSFGTPDAGEAKDDRDTASIKIGASDAGGNAAAMPSNATASLKQAGGTAVASAAYTASISCSNDARINCSLVININQAAASPLPSGDYIATVRGRGITALEVPLTLAGKAKTVNVELGDLPGLGGNWPVNITVLDAGGVPVADGTELRLNARGVAAATSDVVLISKPNEGSDGVAVAKTKNGMVSATLTVIARGRGVLSVSAVSGSGDSVVTDASDPGVVLDTRTAALPGTAYGGPVEFQSADGMPALGVIARWRSSSPGYAADALALVSEAEVLWLHNGRSWRPYAVGEDGAALPGSRNFVVVDGDFLWYSAGQ